MNQLCSGWTGGRRGCGVPWCPICRAKDPPPLAPEPPERIAVPTGDFPDDEAMRG